MTTLLRLISLAVDLVILDSIGDMLGSAINRVTRRGRRPVAARSSHERTMEQLRAERVATEQRLAELT